MLPSLAPAPSGIDFMGAPLQGICPPWWPQVAPAHLQSPGQCCLPAQEVAGWVLLWCPRGCYFLRPMSEGDVSWVPLSQRWPAPSVTGGADHALLYLTARPYQLKVLL